MPQQPPRGRTGRTLVARSVRGAALVGTLALLPLATACSGDGDGSAESKQTKTSARTAPSAGVVAPAKVEVIAALTGCKVKIRTDAEELREGVCRTAAGDYLITTFPAEKYKLTWLDSAAIYGGKYLVGPQWAISAKPKMLEPLRAKVGGTIQDLNAMRTASPAPSAS
ncbi:hypothetical protein O1Q96_28340 [Streptomyces sp. Qhu-G9]|uniref:hypothetical protein n=1 Tax=Streptomyces sp. Qhu-G9 TaxID=3452799 RepID=UPI0022AC1B75|nr:hypothetical protein [Streptomyces aurantiacus]WAU83253.1 hypothetical protein O1Q96_28340 [Streptomyces aurantiacus]